MRIVKSVIFTIIILGVIGIAINLMMPDTISIVQKTNINGLDTYTINVELYLENLNTTIHTTPTMSFNIPELDDPDFLGVLTYIANILILVINFLLFPIRVLGYISTLALAIIGVNTTNPNGGLEWLVNIVTFFRDVLQLDFI